jgi:formate dehydrogenase major subunit
MFLAVRDLYKKEGGALPEQVINLDWKYTSPVNPDLARR